MRVVEKKLLPFALLMSSGGGSDWQDPPLFLFLAEIRVG